MKEILILTGACGVGKSTISIAWAKAKKGVVIESDYFTEWIYNDIYERFKEGEEMLVAELAIATTKIYLNHHMPVAIENVWSPAGINKIKNSIEGEFPNINVKVIWLTCDIAENHRRDELRIPENQMKNRVDIVNAELEEYDWPSYVTILNTTNLTVEETLVQIKNI